MGQHDDDGMRIFRRWFPLVLFGLGSALIAYDCHRDFREEQEKRKRAEIEKNMQVVSLDDLKAVDLGTRQDLVSFDYDIKPFFHILQEDETLTELKRKYNRPLQDIMDTNQDIGDPKKLPIGTKVRIPGYGVYTMKYKDTLYSLAKRYDIKVQDILDMNPDIEDPNQIDFGQEVVVPFSSKHPVIKEKLEKVVKEAKPIGEKPKNEKQSMNYDFKFPYGFEKLSSPNFEDKNINIRCIVMHSSGGTGTSMENTFLNPNNEVSAHYAIMEDGVVKQFVEDTKRAHHAGKSEWKVDGKLLVSLNDYSIGIELAGWAGNEFFDKQYDAAIPLVGQLAMKYNIPVDRKHIIAHSEISPGRKPDPGSGFDWDRFMKGVKDYIAKNAEVLTVDSGK